MVDKEASMIPSQDRVHEDLFECDHMRLVVHFDNTWVHWNYGRLGTVCSAGVYRVTYTITGEHTLNKLVTDRWLKNH